MPQPSIVAKSVPPVRIGPWGGIDNVHSPGHKVFQQGDEKQLPFLRSAVNVDIDDDGWVSTRPVWERIDISNAHSLFEYGDSTYAVVNNRIVELTETGMNVVRPVAGPTSFTVLNGKIAYTDGQSIGFLDGALPIMEARDGDQVVLSGMPPGNALTYWKGRLLVARGSTLYLSEPMGYGSFDTVRGALFFEQPIEWIAGIGTGLYVGLTETVRFLRGTDPAELEQVVIPGRSAGGRVVSSTGLVPQDTEGAPEVAVWFSERGFAIGQESGKVIYPQQMNIRDMPTSRGYISFYNDRLTVIFD